MFNSLQLSNFRAFERLDIAPLNHVNLIAGANDIGKTALLEAIFLANAPLDKFAQLPHLFRNTTHQNHQPTTDTDDNFWSWLFYQKNLNTPWKIALTSPTSENKVIGQKEPTTGRNRLLIQSNASKQPTETNTLGKNTKVASSGRVSDLVQAELTGEGTREQTTAIGIRASEPAKDAELVNQISVQNEDDELAEYLRVIEPRLQKLKYLRLPGHTSPYVYADIGFGKGRELIPTTQLGQGFARMLNLFATLMADKTQILLIDEFENGLQHDALVPVWNALIKITQQRKIQIFATTHSIENITAAHASATQAGDYCLSLIKLHHTENKRITATVFGSEMLETALETNLEIR